jgi:FtsP/CotA-like multicopper oxidase with cupredoxin domain
MKTFCTHTGRLMLLTVLALALMTLYAATAGANAVIPGISGNTFNLSVEATHIDTPDGDSMLIWCYRDMDGNTPCQYPGPTLIVNQGDTITINITNNLAMTATSMVFPGQGLVTAGGDNPAGVLTAEADPGGGTANYSFAVTEPGTYLYHSGTRPELQVEMGLVGAIIVRPTGFNQNTNRTAYGHPDTAYDHEYLFLLSEMDPVIHNLVDFGFPQYVDNTKAFPVLWFINGRNGPDTLSPPAVPWMPHQPYDALARTRPGEKVLLRFVGAGRNPHPFHPHGNHSIIIARDGRMLESTPGAGPDLGTADFTYDIAPGATYDTVFTWTGKKLGWDIYGDPSVPEFAHNCNDGNGDDVDDITFEYCPDHGKPIPVSLPGLQDLSFGGYYSGSAFLGHFGNLPPGEGGLNLNGGLFFMWHSHDEKELTNNDIFPGGMLTFVIIEPPGTPIP